ncbi:uncharacterized protein LOC122380948 [Amphibalanus amphitrite]|uniref:uncharacterized protein LOC122380948 n=1 Tax=Amphibalanus amphitrite TaxID=1232801 RepID=UPI001C912586|nr:uncharacterized protein LOC122380948 [Amphibalanus amphitrite]
MSDEHKIMSSGGRELRVTEKGRSYQASQKGKLYVQLLKRLKSTGSLIVDSIEQEDRSRALKDFDKWKHDYVELIQTYDVLCLLLEDEEKRSIMDKHVLNLSEVNELKNKFESHLTQSAEGTDLDVQPSRSAAGVPRSSKVSDTSTEVKAHLTLMRLEMEQKKAELKAKAAMSKKKLLLKEKQEQLDLEQEQLEIETEQMINEAKLKVIDRFDPDAESEAPKRDVDDAVGGKDETTEAHRENKDGPELDTTTAACYEEARTRAHTQDEDRFNTETLLQRLTDALTERNAVSKLPTMEPDVFKGNVEKFPMWLKSFETYIEHQTRSPIERLHFLGRYTAGEAKAAIVGWLHLRTEEAYKQAKERLIDRYGNDFVVSHAYRVKLKEWPAVKSGDGRALRDFSDYLKHCQAAAAESSQHLRVLDDYLEMQTLVQKLPKYMVDRWKRTVDQWLYGEESTGRHPPFSEFVRFVAVEARIACGPVALPTQEEKQATAHKMPRGKARTFMSSTEVRRTHTGQGDNSRVTTCVLCQKQHSIKDCEVFKKMTVANRNSKVNQVGLCRGCLRRGHKWKECRTREKCGVCSRWHPTLLHDESLSSGSEMQAETAVKQRVDSAPHATSLRSGSVGGAERSGCSHSLVLPVLLSHRSNSEHQLLVYALLDSQSDACFVSQSVCETLNIEGRNTKLELSTMTGKSIIESTAVEGLVIQPLNEEDVIKLPTTYSRPEIPCSEESIPKKDTAVKWKHLEAIADKMPTFFQDAPVALLLGTDCPRVIKPLEVVCGQDEAPWAVRTHLGWGIVGCVGDVEDADSEVCHLVDTGAGQKKRCHFAFKSRVREVSPLDVLKRLESDFQETRQDSKTGLSVDDQQFLKKMSAGIRQREDGHLEMPLPLKDEKLRLPNNRTAAMQRLKGLKAKLVRNESYRRDYVGFMEATLAKGYAEEVPNEELKVNDGRVWYIPHHGIYHPQKDKIRVVFDCSAAYEGHALNSCLLQGPDLTRSLTGILCRFRKQPVAGGSSSLMLDLTAVASAAAPLGVRARPVQQLHSAIFEVFLWWKDGKMECEPGEFRMKTHLFGATSSPACAMFALRAAADDHQADEEKAAEFVRNDFYIDDGLTSVQDVESGIGLIAATRALCERKGFKVHKILSNSIDVVRSVPMDSRCVGLQSLDVGTGDLPVQRTLGVQWNVETDTLSIEVRPRDKQVNRRGILSVVSSVFDPLGLVSPFVLKGKLLLRDLCRGNFGWDEPVPEVIVKAWKEWMRSMLALENVSVPRCYVHEGLRDDMTVELHHFSDASSVGYGQCSYLRTVASDGTVSCSLIVSKSRVAPIKPITVPRLELTAAVLSVRISRFLQEELKLQSVKEVFWTDSMVVLGYIANEARRFHVYVANRVQEIRNHTERSQWRHIATDDNPADLASRGVDAEELVGNELWWQGPRALVRGALPSSEGQYELRDDDPEVKRSVAVFSSAASTEVSRADLHERLEYFSDWRRAKQAVARCIWYTKKLLHRVLVKKGIVQQDDSSTGEITVADVTAAETLILRALQQKELDGMPVEPAGTGGKLKKLSRLDPIVKDGLVCVGGRLRRGSFPEREVHPVILPNKSHVTTLIVRDCHEKVGHAGRGLTLARVRSSGFWVVGGRRAVARLILQCVTCKKLRGKTQQQKMADLPADRLEAAPPFTFSGVDLFGPFYRGDLYCRRRWRRVQRLANEFWRRWRSDFLPNLQERKKWTTKRTNIEEDDIVLIVDDETPRCHWMLGRVAQVHPAKDQLVRRVTVERTFSPPSLSVPSSPIQRFSLDLL